MAYYGKPDYEVRQVSDYSHIVCGKCSEVCELDARGFDGAIPTIEITCPKCGSTGVRKLHKGGSGFSHDTEWQQYDRTTPPDGVRLILKVADRDNDLTYATGIIDQHNGNKLRFLSQENPAATRVIFWKLVP
ncbi:MAG TPA: hypothetical protein VF938_03880 [Candidatus Angelobacter sp.]